jgi:hypothetical protein
MGVDRYMLGVEKTFMDGLWSVELRMPLIGSRGAIFDDGFTTDGFSLGNLAVIAKRLIYESETAGVAIGSAVSAPTGDDARFAFIDEIFTINADFREGLIR